MFLKPAMAGLIKAILHHGEEEHNPLTLSDHQILDQIITTHVHTESKFDVDSLFNLVESILKRSTHIVDNVLQVIITATFHLHT